MTPPRILIIAGSDSGGGAGIQADIKTVTMLGGFAMTAITAITAQDTRSVEAIMAVPADLVCKQIDMVLDDLGADAIKIGMIGAPEIALAVAERLERLGSVPIVFDPVMVASSGSILADAATIAAFERLMAAATLVTPNIPELEVLSGRAIGTSADAEQAALALSSRVGTAILAKGGHLAGTRLVDILANEDESQCWESDRIDTTNTHGTGCTLASAIACGLGAGRPLADAVARARDYTRAAIEAGPGYGSGHGPVGHSLGRSPFEDIHRKVR
ncbi:MAG: bifunctional hydroxymethylpyrimidine kinase/phosphomethylpyrimidine kinase [Sphingosinicella sp.]|nr:bifunctional hydroxymethylpyrimidine kinase/phosphomethylpyrimidine kinase [Sphingosinicella sp.]